MVNPSENIWSEGLNTHSKGKKIGFKRGLEGTLKEKEIGLEIALSKRRRHKGMLKKRWGIKIGLESVLFKRWGHKGTLKKRWGIQIGLDNTLSEGCELKDALKGK